MPQEHQVLVKRKAHEEPLELLYLDDHDHHQDSPRKRRQVFRRVQAADPPPPAFPPLDKQPKDVLSKVKNSTIKGRSRSPRPRLEPRRLRMLKDRVSSGVLGLPRNDGLKRKAGSQLVVFEELAEEPLRESHSVIPTIELPTPQPEDGVVERSRKRPNVTPAERLWRQASRSNFQPRSRSASPFPGHGAEDHLGQSVESLKLAEQLQSFAKEETDRDERRAAAQNTDADAAKDKLAEGFVYDRYIRCDTPSVSGEEGSEQDATHLGYLVIAQEEEAAWTAYLDEFDRDDDDDDDIDRLEDDEDSNGKSFSSAGNEANMSPAEDYYTNDYPDEDLGSLSSFESADGVRAEYDSDYDLNDPAHDEGFSDSEKWEMTGRMGRLNMDI